MDEGRLPKQAYLMLFSQDQNRKRCWATEIREMLSSTGFYFVWLNQGVPDVSGFLKQFRQRLVDIFIQEWTGTIRDRERYSLYNFLKDDFGSSVYLYDVSVYCFRVALSQIRFGVLPINNNLNRYGKELRNSLCPFCKNQVEDEKHLLLNCSLYIDLRNRFLSGLTDISLVDLIRGIDKELSRLVGKFIFYAVKRRQELTA